MLLNLILKFLNKARFQVLLDTLEIDEIRGAGQSLNNVRQQFIQNRYLAEIIRGQLHSSSGSPFRSVGGARERILTNAMIAQSIQCLNQIVRLAIQSETYSQFEKKRRIDAPRNRPVKDGRGLRLYYAEQLRCVHEMKQLLCEPSAQSPLFLKCNLVSLMAFYSRLEYQTTEDAAKMDDKARQFVISKDRQLTIENNILATEFLRLACQMWQLQHAK